jgi:purine-binding chemotaxis protein CheW
MQERRESALLCRIGGLLCALPIEHVEETMRPLAVEPVVGVPSFVRGVAVVRGSAVPVLDAAALLGRRSQPTRFVTVKAGPRRIALAVDAVIGIGTLTPGSHDQIPNLFQHFDSDAVAAVGTLDAGLIPVLQSARLIAEGA